MINILSTERLFLHFLVKIHHLHKANINTEIYFFYKKEEKYKTTLKEESSSNKEEITQQEKLDNTGKS